jgi:hypothetical protein
MCMWPWKWQLLYKTCILGQKKLFLNVLLPFHTMLCKVFHLGLISNTTDTPKKYCWPFNMLYFPINMCFHINFQPKLLFAIIDNFWPVTSNSNISRSLLNILVMLGANERGRCIFSLIPSSLCNSFWSQSYGPPPWGPPKDPPQKKITQK